MRKCSIIIFDVLILTFFFHHGLAQIKPHSVPHPVNYGPNDKNYTAFIRKNCRFYPNKNLDIRTCQGCQYEELKTELNFRDSDNAVWTAPVGTLTDGASIPELLLSFAGDKYASDVRFPAIVHDAYCGIGNNLRRPPYQAKSRNKVSHMFYEACIASNMNVIKAKTFYVAVYLGGPKWTVPNEELEYNPIKDIVLKDLPSVPIGLPIPSERMWVQFQVAKDWIKDLNPQIWIVEAWSQIALTSLKRGNILPAPKKRVVDIEQLKSMYVKKDSVRRDK